MYPSLAAALRAAFAALSPSVSAMFVEDVPDGRFSVSPVLSARSTVRVSHFGTVTLRPIAPLVEMR